MKKLDTGTRASNTMKLDLLLLIGTLIFCFILYLIIKGIINGWRFGINYAKKSNLKPEWVYGLLWISILGIILYVALLGITLVIYISFGLFKS